VTLVVGFDRAPLHTWCGGVRSSSTSHLVVTLVVGLGASLFLHAFLTSSLSGTRLNLYPRALERPTPIRHLTPVLPDDELVSLSVLDTGVWAFKSPSAHKDLLSTWPSNMWFEQPHDTTVIPSAYLTNLQPAREGDFIQYAHVGQNPGFRRYQYPWAEPVRYMDTAAVEEVDLRSSLEAFSPARGAFGASTLSRSQDGGPPPPSTPTRSSDNASADSAMPQDSPSVLVAKPPGIYQEKVISYSRLGVSGFDFEHYNHTRFSGLENTLANSYVNAGLQMLFFLPPLRRALQSHLCEREFCFSCELGFLFKMLEHSCGSVCQASNLLRVLGHIPLAKELDLVALVRESFADQRMGIALIERFVTFMLRQLQSERNADEPDIISQLIGCQITLHTTCRTCGNRDRHESRTVGCVGLSYPRDTSTQLAFGALLHSALAQSWSGPRPDSSEWCHRCGNKQPSAVRVAPNAFPPYIFVSSNLGSHGAGERKMWRSAASTGDAKRGLSSTAIPLSSPGGGGASGEDERNGFTSGMPEAGNASAASWIPAKVKLTVDPDTGALQVEELAGMGDAPNTSPQSAIYKLTALLCHIHDPRKFPGPGHSVLEQRVDAEHVEDRSQRSWYLFNDFQVVKTSVREALSFDGVYKNAVMLVLTRVDDDGISAVGSALSKMPSPSRISSAAFFAPPLTRAAQPRTYSLRTEDDLPHPGELLPIDAEFVSLAPEVNKTLQNGSSVLVRPMHLALARVSVLREVAFLCFCVLCLFCSSLVSFVLDTQCKRDAGWAVFCVCSVPALLSLVFDTQCYASVVCVCSVPALLSLVFDTQCKCDAGWARAG
jgi:hypothetical protein